MTYEIFFVISLKTHQERFLPSSCLNWMRYWIDKIQSLLDIFEAFLRLFLSMVVVPEFFFDVNIFPTLCSACNSFTIECFSQLGMWRVILAVCYFQVWSTKMEKVMSQWVLSMSYGKRVIYLICIHFFFSHWVVHNPVNISDWTLIVSS